MEDIYQRRIRSPIAASQLNGLKRFHNLAGPSYKSPGPMAFDPPIRKHTTPLYLAEGMAIPDAAPFSLAIRNASYNLNADPRLLYRTPRSGLAPYVRGAEGDDVDDGINYLSRDLLKAPELNACIREQLGG